MRVAVVTVDMHDEVAGCIVEINRKRAGKSVPAVVDDHFLMDRTRTDEDPAGVIIQYFVSQSVCGRSDLLPDAQTEVAGCRRARRIHDFGTVAMPLAEPYIDRCSVGWAVRVVFSSQSNGPHAHDVRASRLLCVTNRFSLRLRVGG